MVFKLADAVLGGDGAAQRQGLFIHQFIHGIFIGIHFIAQYLRQKHIVMQAAVAQVAEYHDVGIGKAGADGIGASGHKGGHSSNRQGDVVLDAGADIALGGGNIFAQRPQVLPLGVRLRYYGFIPALLVQQFGQRLG